MRSAWLALSCLGLFGLVLSGCGSLIASEDDEPTETAYAPPLPVQASESAPKVEKPKNLKAIADACTLLAPPQVAALGAGATKPDKTPQGEPKCSWTNGNFMAMASINTQLGGPSKIYQGETPGDDFKPVEIDGFPAARLDGMSTLCKVEVGVAEDQSLELNYQLIGGETPEMKDPCSYAERLSAEMLKNIPDA